MTQRAPTARAQHGENDLAVLHPNRVQTIAGVRVTMREYGFVEGIELADRVQRIVDVLSEAAFAGTDLTPGALRPAFSKHPTDVVALMAAACDQPEDWVRGLNDADGQTLMLMWWVTNADFFVRRVIEAVTVQQLTQASAGPTSTPPSSLPDTTPNASVATHAVN